MGFRPAIEEVWSQVREALEEHRAHCEDRGGGKITFEVDVDAKGLPHLGPVTTKTKPRPWRSAPLPALECGCPFDLPADTSGRCLTCGGLRVQR